MRSLILHFLGSLMLASTCFLFACRGFPLAGESAPISPENLELSAALDTSVADLREGASISITLYNKGMTAVAVCKCFGVRQGWFYLEFTDKSSNLLPDRSPEYDIFTEAPYQCLGPGEKITLRKNLWKWYPEFGSGPEIDSNPNSFNLSPGHYRIRVVYLDNGSKASRCRGINGRVESSWMDLEVPAGMRHP